MLINRQNYLADRYLPMFFFPKYSKYTHNQTCSPPAAAPPPPAPPFLQTDGQHILSKNNMVSNSFLQFFGPASLLRNSSLSKGLATAVTSISLSCASGTGEGSSCKTMSLSAFTFSREMFERLFFMCQTRERLSWQGCFMTCQRVLYRYYSLSIYFCQGCQGVMGMVGWMMEFIYYKNQRLRGQGIFGKIHNPVKLQSQFLHHSVYIYTQQIPSYSQQSSYFSLSTSSSLIMCAALLLSPKHYLVQYTPCDSPLYPLLSPDNLQNLDPCHIIQAGKYILTKKPNPSAFEPPPALQVQVLFEYAFSKLAFHLPKFIRAVTRELQYGEKERQIESMARQVLRTVNLSLRKLQELTYKHFEITADYGAQFITQMLIASDDLDLHYQILRLTSILSLSYPHPFNRIDQTQLLPFDQPSFLGLTHPHSIKPCYHPPHSLEFSQLPFSSNCYITIQKDYNDSDLDIKTLLRYRIWRVVSFGTQQDREKLLLVSLWCRRNNQKEADWFKWQFEDLAEQMSEGFVQELRVLYEKTTKHGYNQLADQHIQIFRGWLEREKEYQEKKETNDLSQKELWRLANAFELTSWINEKRQALSWWPDMRLFFEQKLCKFLADYFTDPTPTCPYDLGYFFSILSDQTFSPSPQYHRLLTSLLSLKTRVPPNSGLMVLLNHVFSEQIIKKLQQDKCFKSTLYSNKLLMSELLKMDNYKLEYTNEQKTILSEILTDRKINISGDVLREVIRYYFVKGELKEEIREYLTQRPFLYVATKRLDDVKLGVFTVEEKLAIFARHIDRCKNQKRPLMRGVAEKYGNGDLQVALITTYERIINMLLIHAKSSNYFVSEKNTEGIQIVKAFINMSRMTIDHYLPRTPSITLTSLTLPTLVSEFSPLLQGRPHTNYLLDALFSPKSIPQHTQTYLLVQSITKRNCDYLQISQELKLQDIIVTTNRVIYDLDEKKEGFEKREEIVAFIRYLLEEYEGNFMRQIRDYVERRFVKSKEETKKDRLDHKFQFMTQVNDFQSFFTAKYLKEYGINNPDGVAFNYDKTKGKCLSDFIDSLNHIFQKQDLFPSLTCDSPSQPPSVTFSPNSPDSHLFLLTLSHLLPLKSYLLPQLHSQPSSWLSLALRTSNILLQFDIPDIDSYFLLSSLRDNFVEYLTENWEEVGGKVEDQNKEFVEFYVSYMRLTRYEKLELEELSKKAEKNQKYWAKSGEGKKRVGIGRKQVEEIGKRLVYELYYPADLKTIKKIYKTITNVFKKQSPLANSALIFMEIAKKRFSIPYQIQSPLNSLQEWEKCEKSLDSSLRSRLNFLYLCSLSGIQSTIIYEKIIRQLMCEQFFSLEYNQNVLTAIHQVKDDKILREFMKFLQPHLSQVVKSEAKSSQQRKHLFWSVMGFLEVQSRLVLLDSSHQKVNICNSLIDSKNLSIESLLQAFTVLFLERLQYLRQNIPYILKHTTLKYLSENFYQISNITEALKTFKKNIFNLLPPPYLANLTIVEQIYEKIVNGQINLQEYINNDKYEGEYLLEQTIYNGWNKHSGQDPTYTSLLNLLNYFPRTIHFLLHTKLPQLVQHLTSTCSLFTSICPYICFCLPQHLHNLLLTLTQQANCDTLQPTSLKVTLQALQALTSGMLKLGCADEYERTVKSCRMLREFVVRVVGVKEIQANARRYYERVGILKECRIVELVKVVQDREQAMEVWRRFGVVVLRGKEEGVGNPTNGYKKMVGLRDCARKVEMPWEQATETTVKQYKMADLEEWLDQNLADKKPEEIVDQPYKQFKEKDDVLLNEQQQVQAEGVDAADQQQIQITSQQKTGAFDLIKYQMMSPQKQTSFLKQRLQYNYHNNFGSNIDLPQLLPFLNLNVQEFIQDAHPRQYLSDHLQKFIESQRVLFKKILSLIQQFQLCPQDKIDLSEIELFVNERLEGLRKFNRVNIVFGILLSRVAQNLKLKEGIGKVVREFRESNGWVGMRMEGRWFQKDERKEEVVEGREGGGGEEVEDIFGVKQSGKEEKEERKEEKKVEEEEVKEEKEKKEEIQKIEIVEEETKQEKINQEEIQKIQCQEVGKLKDFQIPNSKSDLENNIKQFCKQIQFLDSLEPLPDQIIIFFVSQITQAESDLKIQNIHTRFSINNFLWRLIVDLVEKTNSIPWQAFRPQKLSREPFIESLFNIYFNADFMLLTMDPCSSTYRLNKYFNMRQNSGSLIDPSSPAITITFRPVKSYPSLNPQAKCIDTPIWLQNKLSSQSTGNILNNFSQCLTQHSHSDPFLLQLPPFSLQTSLSSNLIAWSNHTQIDITDKLISLFQYNVDSLRNLMDKPTLSDVYVECVRHVLRATMRKLKDIEKVKQHFIEKGSERFDLGYLCDPSERFIDGQLVENMLSSELGKETVGRVRGLAELWEYVEMVIELYCDYKKYIPNADRQCNLYLTEVFKVINYPYDQHFRKHIDESVSSVKRLLQFNPIGYRASKQFTPLQQDPRTHQLHSFLLPYLTSDQHFSQTFIGATLHTSAFLSQQPPAKKLQILKDLIENYSCVEIEIDRKSIWLTTLKEIQMEKLEDIRKKNYEIKFVEEDGIDGGGLHLEWIAKVIQEVTQTNTGLFARTSQNWLLPSVVSKAVLGWREHFRMFGRLLGKFFVDNQLVKDVPLCPYILKLLKNQQPDLEDMKYYDIQMYQSLQYLLNNDIDQDFGVTFSEKLTLLGQPHTVQFLPSGTSTAVTNHNKQSYVHHYVYFKLISSIHDQLQELLTGFRQTCPTVDCFTLDQLITLFSDNSDLNIDEFQKDVTLRNCQKDTHEVLWFFDILRGFNKEERKAVLRFMTSRDRLPEDRFKSFKLFLEHDENKLPSASTCDSRIVIGIAKSREELEGKLRYSMRECEGFHKG